MRVCPFTIMLLSLQLPLLAVAKDPPANKSANKKETKNEPDDYEVVVVGKRLPEKPFLADRSISALNKKTIQERAPRTTPEALWEAPGVFVQQTNHGGGSPILRGMIGPQNLILVDGVRLNNSVYRTGPLQYLNLIDPLALERIEVMRGPGSVLYGSDAMGGVIQVHPLAPRDFRAQERLTAGGSAHFGYASANQRVGGHGHLDAGRGPVGVLAGVTYFALQDLTGGRDVGTQVHSGYDHWSSLATATYHILDGPRLGLTLTASHLFTQILGAGRTDKLVDKRSLQLYDNDDHLAYVRLHGRYAPARTSGELTLSVQHFFERKDAIAVEDDLVTAKSTTRDETTANTLGLDLHLLTRLLANRLRINYGGMWYRDWVGAVRLRRTPVTLWQEAAEANYPDGSTYDNFGAFLMVEGDALRLAGGHIVRLGGGYRLHGMSGHAPATGVLPEVDISDVGHVVTGSIQYLYEQRATAALTFSQGFRAPNLNEAVMLGDTGKFFHLPNGDLAPERIDTVELLLRGRWWRLTAGVSWYVSLLHDVIKREEITDPAVLAQWSAEAGGKEIWWNVNGGDGLLWGSELQLRLDLGYGFSMSGNLTYTWGEEEVPGGADVPLSRIPPLFGAVTARYDTSLLAGWRGFAELYVLAVARQGRLSVEDDKDVRIPEGGTPGWWTLNLRFGVLSRRHLRIGLAVENLLNESYKYHGSGVYGAGTNARLFLEAKM